MQYEGLESSPYIFCTGATTNQQIVPALDYRWEKGKKSVFPVGGDYVFPRIANKIIKAYAAADGMTIAGEEYTPLGNTEYSTIVNKPGQARPDVVFNTLNGDSDVAFFKQLRSAGYDATTMPAVSVSVAEEEGAGIGPANVAGQLVGWNYYQTTSGATNATFRHGGRGAGRAPGAGGLPRTDEGDSPGCLRSERCRSRTQERRSCSGLI